MENSSVELSKLAQQFCYVTCTCRSVAFQERRVLKVIPMDSSKLHNGFPVKTCLPALDFSNIGQHMALQ